MATIRESIQLVQSMYSRGIQSKDSRLSSRHIYSELLNARSTILRQQDTKGQVANSWAYQTLPCVELQQAQPYEATCVPNSGCIVLRTKYKLPVHVAGLDNMLIRYVTTLDGVTRFDPTTFETVKYDAGKKYTSTSPNYYIKNEYGFITHKTMLKGVVMTGLFDDPIAAYQFPSMCGPCAGCECLDIQDYDFPIDRNSLRAVTQLAYERLVILFSQMKQDKANNASDDAGGAGGQMVHQPQSQIPQE